MKKFLLCCALCHQLVAGHAQTNYPVVVAVVGSSTAAGTGPLDPQNAFVNRYRTHLKSLNSASEVFNIAVGGSTTYHCSPVWYNPGASRPAPVYARSISRAVLPDNGFRKPDAIIISLPTNDGASAYTLAETQANFERMVATADSLHIPVWVTTSQPRNDLPQSQINLLLGLRDWVLPRFGTKAINFWADIAGPDNLIKPALRGGDLIHLNDSAHGILFNKVLAAAILDTIAKGPVRLGSFTANVQGQQVLLQWESHRERYMQRYIVERSTDSLNWTAVNTVNASGTTIAPHQYSSTDAIPSGTAFYRLCMEDIYARKFYTAGKKVGSGPPPQPPVGNPAVLIAVVGSSTAAGDGAMDFQKAFVNRYRTYLKTLNTASDVYNIAMGGTNTYYCNPLWYNPGSSKPAPVPARSISRALNPDNGMRKPDAIIVAMSTNDAASGFTLAETQANFERIMATADSLHIPVWVTTSQPRNDLFGGQPAAAIGLRDWVLQRFGPKGVDFWTDIAGPDNLIKPEFRAGDMDNVNDSAHGILYNRIVNARIIDSIAMGPVRFGAFSASRQGQDVLVQWQSHRERYMQQYVVERSADSLNWVAIGTVAANGSTIVPRQYSSTDLAAPNGVLYYRLRMEDIYARKFFTAGKKTGSVPPPPQPPVVNQPIVVAVIGSSTAQGQGPADPQKAFANRYRAYLKSLNTASDVYNIATGGTNSYHCNPVWYNPGPNKAAPILARSITRALSPDNGMRKPDAIIVAMSTNDAASGFTLAESKANFERIVATADSLHIPVWVTTSQPRNDLFGGQPAAATGLRDWVLQRFGPKGVDFWTDIAGPDNLIKPMFSAGDPWNLNDTAHGILYARLLNARIVDTIAKGPVRFASFSVTAEGQGARIQWESHRERYMQQYIVERSADSISWTAIGTVPANGSNIVPHQYSRVDGAALTSPVYYRLCMEDSYARKFYTHGVRFTPTGSFRLMQASGVVKKENRPLAYPNPAGNSFRVRGLLPGRHTLQVFNNAGQLVFEDRAYVNEKEVNQHWRSGVYYLVIDGGKYSITLLRI